MIKILRSGVNPGLDKYTMDPEEYYTLLQRHTEVSKQLVVKYNAIRTLISTPQIDYISKPFSEVWTNLLGSSSLRCNRKVMPFKSPLAQQGAGTYLYRIVVSDTIGFIGTYDTNATYYNTSCRREDVKHHQNNRSLLTLINLLHTHGKDLSTYVSPHALKQARFIALIKALDRYKIYKLVELQKGVTLGSEIEILLPPNFIYYLPETAYSKSLQVAKYPLQKLVIKIKGTAIYVTACSTPNSQCGDLQIFGKYGSPIKEVHQIFPYLYPYLLKLGSTLMRDKDNIKKQVHSQFEKINKDLNKYLLINSF